MKCWIILMFILLPFGAFSQTLAEIRQIEKKYQDRLDTGEGMLGTTREHYLAIDSLLNLAYNNLRRTMTQPEKDALKADQLKWLKKRDAYFKEVKKEYDDNIRKGDWGADMYMTVYSNYAEYVKDRVEYLIKKRNNK